MTDNTVDDTLINKYENGKIYKLVSKNTDKIYIGATCKTLEDRLKKHESHFLDYYIGKHTFVSSFKILELGDYDIELMQLFPCENRKQLHERESYYIRKHIDEIVNKNISNRNRKQYYLDNIEKEKENHKIWYEKNKDKVKEYKKQYLIDNKERIKEYKKKPFTCVCGKIMTQDAKYIHFKSKGHLNFINPPIEEELKIKKQRVKKVKKEKVNKLNPEEINNIINQKEPEKEIIPKKVLNYNDLMKKIKKIQNSS